MKKLRKWGRDLVLNCYIPRRAPPGPRARPQTLRAGASQHLRTWHAPSRPRPLAAKGLLIALGSAAPRLGLGPPLPGHCVGEGGGGRDTHCQGTLPRGQCQEVGKRPPRLRGQARAGSQGMQLPKAPHLRARVGARHASLSRLPTWGPGSWGSAGSLISTPKSRPQAGVRCQPPSPILAVFSLLDYSVNLPCSAFASPGFPSMWKSHWSSCHFPTMAS